MEDASISHGNGSHTTEQKVPYKSWKKKYRKLRHKFEGVMRRSDELFKHDLIATEAIKRITEENNRLLDLLIDLNSDPHIPQKYHQHIGSPTSQSPARFMSPDTLEAFSKREFFIEEEAPVEDDEAMTDDDVPPPPAPPPDTEEMELDDDDRELLATALPPPITPVPKPKRSRRIIRRPISPPQEPVYTRGSTPPRFRETSPFLNPIEDEELPPGTIVHYHGPEAASPTATFTSVNGEEEHHWPRNPMSVYCWLRKYQPQVFLQDSEAAPTEKATTKKGRGKKTEEGEEGEGSEIVQAPVRRKPGPAIGSKRRRKTMEDGEESAATPGKTRKPVAKRPRKALGVKMEE